MKIHRFLLPLAACLPCLLPAQCWNLVREDEFAGSSLDLAKWSFETGGGGWGNNELQYYTSLSTNAAVSGGTLKIIAREIYGGYDYTSARIRSLDKGDWTYGKFEARMKLPIGQGIWPAFWMLPTGNAYGGWPSSGEIDLMELVGHQPSTVYQTLHYGSAGDHQSQGTSYTLGGGATFADDFHLFGLEWEPNTLRWYLDGSLIYTRTAADIAPYAWVFDQDFHFLLNVAVGGDWPGPPDGTTTFPVQMEVDYVRVYQQLSDIPIAGSSKVVPGATGVTYTLPTMSGTTYSWSVPAGASITAGQGTAEVTTSWGSAGGDVACAVTNACGSATLSKTVTVTANLLENPGFESGLASWNTGTFNGAAATFGTTTSNPQQGAKSAIVEVTALGSNTWDVQLSQTGFSIESGENYTLTFWAKADASGKQLSANFIHPTTYAWYAGTTFTLTSAWVQYSFAFNAPATSAVSMNMDLGHVLGTFTLDNFVFGKTSLLPVEWMGFSAQAVEGQKVRLEWTAWADGRADFFEVQKRTGGAWQPVGEVDARRDVQANYFFMDENPQPGTNLYRLRLADEDGGSSFSPVAAAAGSAVGFPRLSVFPNPLSAGSEVLLFLERRQEVEVSVCGLEGRRLFLIKKGTLEAGAHRFPLEAGNLPAAAGGWLVRAVGEDFQATEKVVSSR